MDDVDPWLLLSGFRQLLLDNAIAPVVIGSLQGNGSCVGLNFLPLIDDPGTGDVLAGMQVRIRGEAKVGVQAVLNRQRDIRAILTFEDRQVGGHLVVNCWRQTSAPARPDDQGRFEVWDTFYLQTDRLGTR